jgi:hypothetical protein
MKFRKKLLVDIAFGAVYTLSLFALAFLLLSALFLVDPAHHCRFPYEVNGASCAHSRSLIGFVLYITLFMHLFILAISKVEAILFYLFSKN